MNAESSYRGLLRYIRVRWTIYAGLAVGALVALVLVVVGVETTSWALALVGLASLLTLVYFVTTSLWAAYEQFVRRETMPVRTLFELGQIHPTDEFVYVGLGIRDTPTHLSRRLTRGHIQAIDVYNPQLTPRAVLARERRPLPALSDPRLTWLEGSIDLLPLPDHSVVLLLTSYTLVEFWQHGDRELLLREIYRVLQPGGHLVLAEPVRSRTQWLMVGPAALRLPTPTYWRRMLRSVGFSLNREKDVGGYYHCFRAEKPLPGAVQQLALDLGI